MGFHSAQAIAARAGANERGMQWLLTALIVLLVVKDIFALPLSLGPGLSVENALLYLIFASLAFKAAVQGFSVQADLDAGLRAMHVAFVLLLAYSTLTMVVAAVIVQYPRYEFLKAGVSLKSRLFDQMAFFAVFFYGLRNSVNAHKLIAALIAGAVIGNLIAVLDAWEIVQAPGLVERLDGRTQGMMKESNQTAAFIACILPGVAAFVLTASGWRKVFWLGGMMACAAAIMLTASRGGFLAVVLSAIWGLFAFRRYISMRKLAATAGAIGLVLLIAIPIVSVRYGKLLVTRIIEDSTSSNLAGASSGRLEIWSGAISTMLDTPLTLFTGFGWEVYATMPFRFAPHNHYLDLWFNLGVIGLACGVALLVICVREARVGVRIEPEYRPALMAFAIGTVALAMAAFFVDLYAPWLWFWAYAGLALRIVVNARRRLRMDAAETSAATRPAPQADRYGWSAARPAPTRASRLAGSSGRP